MSLYLTSQNTVRVKSKNIMLFERLEQRVYAIRFGLYGQIKLGMARHGVMDG